MSDLPDWKCCAIYNGCRYANMTETIATRSGLALQVGKQASENAIEIDLRLDRRRNCVLHWGLRQPGQDAWQLPPQTVWPAQTRAVGAALQTPFVPEDGQQSVRIRLPMPVAYSSLDFVLFFPERRAWDNNGGQNYRIEIAPGKAAGAELESALKEYIGQKKVLFQRVFQPRAARGVGGCCDARRRPFRAHDVERHPRPAAPLGDCPLFVQ